MLWGGFSSVETWHCLKQKKDKKRVLQGIVRLKMKILSSVTHPHIISGLYYLFFLWNAKGGNSINISLDYFRIQHNSK